MIDSDFDLMNSGEPDPWASSQQGAACFSAYSTESEIPAPAPTPVLDTHSQRNPAGPPQRAIFKIIKKQRPIRDPARTIINLTDNKSVRSSINSSMKPQ